MGNYSRKSILLALLLLFVAADGARGQWRIVAPNAVPKYFWGAIHYKDGIIWAGGYDLVFSSDTGKSWNTANFNTQIGNHNGILDISFLDKNTGVVSIAPAGIFITHDQGQTWSGPEIGNSDCDQISFSRQSSDLYVDAPGIRRFLVSHDEGLSWSQVNVGISFTFVEAIDGTLYLAGGEGYSPGIEAGYIEVSNNSGNSWMLKQPGFDGDSYSMDIDSCDPARAYIANENYLAPGDGYSKIYITTNAGQSWTIPFSHSIPYLVGSIANSANALYVGTLNDGILRSTDKGNTWTNIGGPGCSGDCRGIAAISDNIIFALDDAGNIWATFNSGGDSLTAISSFSKFSASPDTLFTSDTVRCDSITRSIFFSRFGCTSLPTSVFSWSFIGPNANDFHVSNSAYDSILVTDNGTQQGKQNAKLVLNLNNGSSDTVSLAGYVNLIPEALSLSTQNVQTDTLGATVAVPIAINGLAHPEDVDLVLHYDGAVDYLGSFSPSGARLDIPGDSSAGRSKLHIIRAAPGVIAGYAKFNAWNDSNVSAHATFDSLNVLTAISPCEYSMPEAATSTISAPSGCGTTMLSQWVHLGKQPKFMVQPNPTEGDVFISSSLDLGAVTIAIYDMLGAERSRWEENMSGNTPITLALPEAGGIYTIVLNSGAGTKVLRVSRE